MSSRSNWEDVYSARKDAQLAAIPPEWIIKVPPERRTNVLDVPSEAGLLTKRELDITETTDVQILLG